MINVFSSILGVVALVLIYLELAGRSVPFLPAGFRAGFIALALIGFAMCMIGGIVPKGSETTINWASPYIILGAILGTVALLALFSMIFLKRVPFVTDKTAFILLAVIIVSKYLVNIVRFFNK